MSRQIAVFGVRLVALWIAVGSITSVGNMVQAARHPDVPLGWWLMPPAFTVMVAAVVWFLADRLAGLAVPAGAGSDAEPGPRWTPTILLQIALAVVGIGFWIWGMGGLASAFADWLSSRPRGDRLLESDLIPFWTVNWGRVALHGVYVVLGIAVFGLARPLSEGGWIRSRTVRAQRFELVDVFGIARATLTAVAEESDESRPEIVLHDSEGEISTVLRVEADGRVTPRA